MWYACVCVCVHDVLKREKGGRERDGDEVYRDGRRERGGRGREGK